MRPSFFKQHFVKRPPISPLRRGLDKWRVGRVRYQLEDEESAPLRGDPNVHNSAGALVAGQLPLVEPGMEDRTIVIQMTFGCCCSEFDAFYLPRKTSLTRAEFEGALTDLNNTLRRPPLWSYVFAPCCFVACCWRDRALHTTLDDLNHRYGRRGAPARSKCCCPPWQRPSSPPVAPWRAPGGSGQLGAPRARPRHWARSHCLGGSS